RCDATTTQRNHCIATLALRRTTSRYIPIRALISLYLQEQNIAFYYLYLLIILVFFCFQMQMCRRVQFVRCCVLSLNGRARSGAACCSGRGISIRGIVARTRQPQGGVQLHFGATNSMGSFLCERQHDHELDSTSRSHT
ncbi:unnamed protein product, partial [Amoebophrya sp. A120]